LNILTPWIAIFVLCLVVSFIGSHLKRERQKQRRLLNKLRAPEQSSVRDATNPTPHGEFDSIDMKTNKQAKLGSYTN